MARRKHERMSPDKKNLIASLIDMYDIRKRLLFSNCVTIFSIVTQFIQQK